MKWRMGIWCSALLMLAGCVNALGSHQLLGQARPESDASDIVLYATAPAKAVPIASVAARSTVFRSDAEKAEIALDQLKEEAAEVGANGIVLLAPPDAVLGKRPGLRVTPELLPVFITKQDHDAMVSGTAIWVPDQR